MTDYFASLDAVIDNAGFEVRSAPPSYAKIAETYSEPCKSCRGTGNFVSYAGRIVGLCFKCKGAGKMTFKTSPVARQQAKIAAVVSKLTKIEAFKNDQPEVFTWLSSQTTFAFGVSLRDAFIQYGSLTDNQLAAARKCIASLNARKEAAVAAVVNAPAIDVAKIEAAFASAKGNGIKRPKLNLGDFNFRPAPASGKNPDSIYVTGQDKIYLGKVQAGRFVKAYACDDTTATEIVAVASDPASSARAYGVRTGSCSCCGRTLTDKSSIDLGIGPICAEKYGF
jgi:hypothetical protein